MSTPRRATLSDLALVISVARYIRRRLPAHIDLQDLVQEGYLGLLEAEVRFNPHLGVPRNAFLKRRIRGRILDYLRSLDTNTRETRRLAESIREARSHFQHKGVEPTREDLAKRAGFPLKKFDAVMQRAELTHTTSLSSKGAGDQTESIPGAENVEETFAKRELLKHALPQAIHRLPRDEQMVILAYYLGEEELKSIAHRRDFTISRASQVKRSGVERLRHKLRNDL